MDPAAAQSAPFVWGIVGTGAIAGLFAEDLHLIPGARLGAVHSRSLDKAQDFAARFGGATAYDDLDAFLADPAIEAVYIATPNNLHALQALAAIAAGKPVLIEKPIALSSGDVEAIAKAAAERGVFAMEAMWTRFLPAIVALRQHLAAGRIGRIRRLRADLSYFHPQQPGSRFFEPALGGGAALDLGVYPLSLALHLLGQPERVEGRWFSSASGVDLRSEFALHYPEATAELSCGFDRDGANLLLIEGSEGSLRIEAPFLKAQRLMQFAPGALATPWRERNNPAFLRKVLDRLPLPGVRRETFPFPGNGLQFQAQAVMTAIRTGATRCETMPLAESAAVLGMIEMVRAQPAAAAAR
ncbi:Gfo/Idh/MocA family protein [Bosea rubneri]|uniref:Gfo/Idh/MocA family oxidoreductase n=1 Tax=Bosea rubneri TaxID=3075434 RepID=A0ABU3SGM9_9HYPH|nr:Gfo/Idh/MocA family oxidoreductase [Bosea sp. ZW T0_25]MDU0343545.1 Gfo/Idh/MocA family oxidoreductase [Bosea sp. ZW T0_25]